MDNGISFSVYEDIQKRTNGEIYLGIVGPVRTGKSTLIKQIMRLLVMPNIANEQVKARSNDELPLRSRGKTITTTEPKFIPQEAVEIQLPQGVGFKIRMIDCVGFMVDGALGHEEDGEERKVKTPWYEEEIAFSKAAEIGTKKVIREHSTVGIVVTTDGTIGELQRENYIQAEQETLREMENLNKPYIVLLNTRYPNSQEVSQLREKMEQEYSCKVVPVNVEEMNMEDITHILEELLFSFPVKSVEFNIPKWMELLELSNGIKQSVIQLAKDIFQQMIYMRDLYSIKFPEISCVQGIHLEGVDMAKGKISYQVQIKPQYYYDMLSDLFGMHIRNEYEFMRELRDMARNKQAYQYIAQALEGARYGGYGCVTPNREDIFLEQPEVIRHGNKYGVKLKAQAPSIHLIKANITTEIAPIVGTMQQAEELAQYITKEGEENIWEVNIFGKNISQLVEEGMTQKVGKINAQSQVKLQETMEKIVNDGNGGMVCIII